MDDDLRTWAPRGSDDAKLRAATARAIRLAISGLEGGQSEVGRRTGITQTEISKLARGARPTPLNIWEMREIETATGRPPGFILTEIGYLPRQRTAREAIMADPYLSADARKLLVAAYDAAVGAKRDEEPPKPKKRAASKR